MIAAAVLVLMPSTAHAVVVFEDGFEGGFQAGWTHTGETAVTNALAHGFSYSYVSFPTNTPGSPDVGVISRPLQSAPMAYLSVWFFDDNLGGKEQFVQVRGADRRPGIGVIDRVFPTTYACTMVQSGFINSGVTRTRGWHEFRIDWALGLGGTVYTLRIDGATVCAGGTSTDLPTSVNIGDAWSYVLTEGRGYWDDVQFGTQP